MLARECPITQMSEILEVARNTYFHRRAPTSELPGKMGMPNA